MSLTTYIGFLRAVNVGGTGKLKMEMLRKMCAEIGFQNAQTYIASGNLVFQTEASLNEARSALEKKLTEYAGQSQSVILRTVPELRNLLENSPFRDEPGNKVIALLMPGPVDPNALKTARNQTIEIVKPGDQALYIYYPEGQGASRYQLSAMKSGTARNMNTIEKVLKMAQDVTDRR